jgi:hypothetical protein
VVYHFCLEKFHAPINLNSNESSFEICPVTF